MRALATRSQSLALGIAVLTAAALGTVSATAAQASGTSTTRAPGVSVGKEKGDDAKPTEPPRGARLAVKYNPTADAPDDLNAANDDFAACMKKQGQSVFPDFEASKGEDGGVLLKVRITSPDFDPTSKSYRKALKTCAPILAKAGLTFPNPSDLPLPTPGKPGKPGEEAPSLPNPTNSIRTA
ncbi:hypothetical protein [Streptomyces pseudovenezuelae]|uniref:Septum formation-related domain-containing protein n=1 Tax=Streptomyces pseudovenezuelae TaxID=67350 RepID=A0ABT6LSH9_9ACTN|nr:hypothetical protein [Streptomyces pseudovenezuelae]MDH6219272.1 hypothetical protein [Streptomyces pseudovenezuelae]